MHDLLKRGEGRFYRGNLHCHSDRSDGSRSPAEVASAYRGAGYDFICLTDHFEAEYGWRVTDTRPLRDEAFTTLIGAELSSGPWSARSVCWVTAIGLPADFPAPASNAAGEVIRRAAETGAFLTLLHPGLNNLPQAAVAETKALRAVHAVEVYNHNMANAAAPDRSNGGYMLDGLLERGQRVMVSAGDDAHFGHPRDRFGGWVEVYSANLEPGRLLASLRAGRYYATQGPAIRNLRREGDTLLVETSEAYAINLTTSGALWQHGTEVTSQDGVPITSAEFDLAPLRGSYGRVVVVDAAGRYAWGNPVWV